MPYGKLTWTNSGASGGLGANNEINAERMGHLENGIEAAQTAAEAAQATADSHTHYPNEIIPDEGGAAYFAISLMPAGSTIKVIKADDVYGAAGSWPATRPTTRTDIYIDYEGDTDPAAISLDWDSWIVT